MKNQTSFAGRIWKEAPFLNQLEEVYEILLKKRNLKTPEKIQEFLVSSLQKLHNPLLMKGMKKVVKRIWKSIKN